MVKFVNLCKHAINLIDNNGVEHVFPPSGMEARVDVLPNSLPEIAPGMTCQRNVYGEVLGLPAPVEGTVYIVSLQVVQALALKWASEDYTSGLPRRNDIVAPATGPKDGAIRFEDGPQKGQVKAVTRWVCP